MDRTLKMLKVAFCLAALLTIPPLEVLAEEEPDTSPDGVEPSGSVSEASAFLQPDPFLPTATQGLFMGYIYFISPERDSMVVSSAESDKPRKVFYLDRSTRVMDGRRRVRPTRLDEGRKVAVWFFSERGVSVAEKVFLVKGEFHREEYIPVTALGVTEPEVKLEPSSAEVGQLP